MVWVNNTRPLGIASFKSIYPKILTSSRVRGIYLISKSYFSVINKTTVAGCLEVSNDDFIELKLAQTHVALTVPKRQQVLQLMMT